MIIAKRKAYKIITLLVFGLIVSLPMFAPFFIALIGDGLPAKLTEFFTALGFERLIKFVCVLIILVLFFWNRLDVIRKTPAR